MHHITLATGVLLVAIGLFGYFGSASENPSPTALIPAGFGVVFIILGLVAHKAGARKHAMHAAAAIALIGALMAASRINVGKLVSDDVSMRRPEAMKFLMALTCFVFVILCVWSFISARRRRASAAPSP
jgi:hypothetical protein